MSKKQSKLLIVVAVLSAIVIAIVLLYSKSDIINSNLVISEICASNTSVKLGVEQQYYDYIELHNRSSEPISLSGYYLSDDIGNQKKWAFPDVSIQSGEYLLVYASGSDADVNGELHANFKLSDSSGVIIVSNGASIVTKVYTPELQKDISYGMSPENNYVYYNILTPGYENNAVYYKSIKSIGASSAEDKSIIINEISAGEQTSIYDEDGDFSDFIELYNTSDQPVDIGGYFLSDDSEKTAKYALPDYTMQPGEYLIVFASGKNKSDGGYIHTNFKLSANETLSLYNSKTEMIDKLEIPTLPNNTSYGRTADHSDRWLYYSSPTPGFENNTTGAESVSASESMKGAQVFISEVMSANGTSIRDGDGDCEDWIELYNQTDHAIPLSGYYLSDTLNEPQKWAFDDNAVIQPGESMIVFASSKNKIDSLGCSHTNFSLSKYNQTIVLSKGNVIMDTLSFGVMKGDVSIGIGGANDSSKYYFVAPTPGSVNNTEKTRGVTSEVKFSEPSGDYSDAVSLTMSCTEKNVMIYYTLDGSTPTTASNLYTSPISVAANTSVRAISYAEGKLTSDVTTATYLINIEDNGLPVVFLTTDSDKLFNGGIYNNDLSDERKVDANIELVETDGTGFNEDVLINKSGNMSALEVQKSFGVYFKEYVGDKELDYNLFPDEMDGVTTYYSFLLRTSGNDWDDLKCKDGMLQTLAATQMDLDYMSYRPAVLYINGQYWGIYNIRDKLNADYITTHHPGADGDNCDIISFAYGVEQGDYAEYNKLMSFIENNNLDDASNWATLESMMDVNNMIDTYLCHIYYSNFDTVNIRWWREKKDGAKWRWMLYDLDYALYVPFQNNLELVTDPEGHGVDKSFDSSLIYSLMKSDNFRQRFMQRTSAYWSNIFNSDVILAKFAQTYGNIAAEMPNQLQRWDISFSHHIDEMNEADDFIRRRPAYFRTMFRNYFGLTEDELDQLLPEQTVTYPKIIIDTSLFHISEIMMMSGNTS